MEPQFRNPYGIDHGDHQRIALPGRMSAVVFTDSDDDHGNPWDEEDGHIDGIRWAKWGAHGIIKAPGERVLYDGTGRYARIGAPMVYDFNASLKVALRDGWDAPPYGEGTPRQRALRAVLADAKRMAAWCAAEWGYIGVMVRVYDRNDECVGHDSLWGVESDGDYWKQIATDMIDSIVEGHKQSRTAAWRAALKERRERLYWSRRDVVTA